MMEVLSIIGLLGSIASIVGIWLTYRQVKAVKSVAEATRDAAEKTEKAFLRTLSTVEVSKYCQLTSKIQDVIANDQINFAIHLCHELKTVLIEQNENQTRHSVFPKETADILSKSITTLGVNIINMNESLIEDKEKLKKDKIIKDLEGIHKLLSEILAKLRIKT